MNTLVLFGLLAVQSVAIPFMPKPQIHARSATLSQLGYIPTFFEPFIGIKDTLPSSQNWKFDLGNGPNGWGNNELEFYTASTSNVHITSRSTLAITPRLTAAGWTSARIETQRADFRAEPGGKLYIEAKLKLGGAPASKQQGIWPAFWALGSAFRNGSIWPGVSEWDFLEVINGIPAMYTTIHCGTAPLGPCNEYSGLSNGGMQSFEMGAWHRVGFEVDRSMCGTGWQGTWEDETLSWYLDGENVFELTGRRVGDEKAWEALAHKEHFLLLNVAVGGNWPGYPNASTIDGPSVGMEVEYVGVWNSFL